MLTAASHRPSTEVKAVAVAEAVAVRDATALKLDGELTDEVWSRAKPIDDFVQREPNDGRTAHLRDQAKVAYDARHIYIAVTAVDPEPEKIVGYLTRRDTDSPSDWIRVVDRLVPRSAHGVRVRRQSGRRQDGPLSVQRRQ